MKQLFKSGVLGVCRWFCPNLDDRASILMYHSIGENNAFFTVRPEHFEEQMKYLKDSGFTLISLRGLIDKIKRQESIANHVVVTFDDGYKDFHEIAFPILKKYSIPATVFIPTGLVGRNFTTSQGLILPLMDMSEIDTLVASGLVECMPHGVTHEELPGLRFDKAAKEIEESRAFLTQHMPLPATVFAFPRGKYTPALYDYVRANGFSGAVTVREGLVSLQSDIFALPRNSIDSSTTMNQFKAKVSRAIDMYQVIKKYV